MKTYETNLSYYLKDTKIVIKYPHDSKFEDLPYRVVDFLRNKLEENVNNLQHVKNLKTIGQKLKLKHKKLWDFITKTGFSLKENYQILKKRKPVDRPKTFFYFDPTTGVNYMTLSNFRGVKSFLTSSKDLYFYYNETVSKLIIRKIKELSAIENKLYYLEESLKSKYYFFFLKQFLKDFSKNYPIQVKDNAIILDLSNKQKAEKLLSFLSSKKEINNNHNINIDNLLF